MCYDRDLPLYYSSVNLLSTHITNALLLWSLCLSEVLNKRKIISRELTLSLNLQ